MRKVLIATPSYDGRIDVWYANSLTKSIVLGLQNDILFQPVYMSYDALIQRARNDLLAIAVKNDFDDIIWIDSDIEWDPEWLLKLLSYEEDVVGGTYPRKSVEETYVVKCAPEDLVVNDKGLIPVQGLGTGFLRMSKAAFTYLWDNSEPYTHNGEDKRWAFNVSIIDGDIISEDIQVCQKLIEGGFQVYLDPTLTCNHIGSLKFSGNFEQWMQVVKGANT